MKKWIGILLCLLILFTLAGCGGGSASSGNGEAGKNEAATEATTEKPEIDVDLTTFSATMVYTIVYDMLESPDKYLGQTVKMKGLFAYYYDEATGNEYFACLIQDATACCAQGVEFILAGEHVYPDDYPELGEEICVQGVFSTYQEGEYTYITMKDAVILDE